MLFLELCCYELLLFYLQTWVIIGNIVSYEIQVFVEYQYTEHKGNKRDK